MSSIPPTSQSFSILDDKKLAIAEVTLWNDLETMREFNLPEDHPWYFFNRIHTPPKIRRRGHATKLMKRLINWADENGYYIFCLVNPYGDLNLKQLTAFYKKFGFKELKKEIMARY